MPNLVAAFVGATALWIVFALAASYDFLGRHADEAWVVTASDKMSNAPSLVRAHAPFQAAVPTRESSAKRPFGLTASASSPAPTK